MPWHALVLELAAGFLATMALLVDVTLPRRGRFCGPAGGSSTSARQSPGDELHDEKREALAEALTVLGLIEQSATRANLIVHNGLAASRRRI